MSIKFQGNIGESSILIRLEFEEDALVDILVEVVIGHYGDMKTVECWGRYEEPNGCFDKALNMAKEMLEKMKIYGIEVTQYEEYLYLSDE